MRFIKSKRKFVFYYIIINIALVLLLFMTFSAFPRHDTVTVKKGQPYITNLDTHLEVEADGNTVVTEKMTIREAKNKFVYEHVFMNGVLVDEASIKLIDSSAKLTHEYTTQEQSSELKLEIESSFVGEETISLQYKVKGLVKHLRDGQLFQFNPWNSSAVDVVDARIRIAFPNDISNTMRVYEMGAVSQDHIQVDSKTLETEVQSVNHRSDTYEIRLWDSAPMVEEKGLGKTSFRSLEDVENDVQAQVKQAQLEDQKYQIFQFLLRIMYIIASAIITIIFGVLLLTNLIETQSVKKYLRFESAPDSLGPGSAGRIIHVPGFGIESAIRAGTLYMATKGLVRCQKDRLSLQLIKQKDVEHDEIEEISALQKFLFADKDTAVLQKEEKDLETTSRKTLNFFNYRKIIENTVQDYHGVKAKGLNKKENVLRYMKTEVILALTLFIEVALFLTLQFSGSQKNYIGYTILEIIMVIVAMIALVTVPLAYYFSQKETISKTNFDELSDWQYFRTFLCNKKLVRNQLMESDDNWREFLMYATVFGSEKTVLSAMKTACPEYYNEVMDGSAKMILDTPEGYFSYTVK